MSRTSERRGILYRILTMHPLLWGAFGVVATYLLLLWLGDGDSVTGGCALCWWDTADNPGVPAATAGPPSALGGKIIKDLIGKKAGVPVFPLKDMIDIASEETDEEQAETAFDKYFDFVLMSDAPEGSVAREITDAKDRMMDFSADKDDPD